MKVLALTFLVFLKDTKAVHVFISLLEAKDVKASSGAHLVQASWPGNGTKTQSTFSACLRWSSKLMSSVSEDSRVVDAFSVEDAFIFYLKTVLPMHIVAFGNNELAGSFK